MDPKPSWKRCTALVAAPLLLLATAASADATPSAASWDDQHMRSNFANRGSAAPRPAIRGLDADGRIAHDAVPTTQVQEQWISVNPHGWQPGPSRRSQSGAGRPFAKGTRFSSPASAAPARSNALRTQATSAPRGRTTP